MNHCKNLDVIGGDAVGHDKGRAGNDKLSGIPDTSRTADVRHSREPCDIALDPLDHAPRSERILVRDVGFDGFNVFDRPFEPTDAHSA